MPITIYSGRPGSGKSNRLAQQVLYILNRNLKWYNKTGILRRVFMNFHLNPALQEKYKKFLCYWRDLEELEILTDVDVVIDEIANYFDAGHWQETSLSSKRWLQQHRKLGIEIYGNCQDFAQIDISFRRMTSDLFYLVKLLSSRDPSPTRPPVKRIWGISVIYTMNPTDYKEDQKENKTSFYGVMFITRGNCEAFNTREKIEPGVYPPFKHYERHCNMPECTFKRIVHN